MTDLDKFRELLDSWGVPYTEGDWEPSPSEPTLHGVTVGGGHAPDSDKVIGYLGFYTSFDFTLEGEFLRMGAWE